MGCVAKPDPTPPARKRRPWTAARARQLRRKIADGTYLTEAKLAVAIEALYTALLAVDRHVRRSRQRRAG